MTCRRRFVQELLSLIVVSWWNRRAGFCVFLRNCPWAERRKGHVMFSSSSKVTFLLLMLPLGLFNAGCSTPGVGAAGFHDVAAGNWDRARLEFTRDYQKQ